MQKDYGKLSLMNCVYWRESLGRVTFIPSIVMLAMLAVFLWGLMSLSRNAIKWKKYLKNWIVFPCFSTRRFYAATITVSARRSYGQFFITVSICWNGGMNWLTDSPKITFSPIGLWWIAISIVTRSSMIQLHDVLNNCEGASLVWWIDTKRMRLFGFRDINWCLLHPICREN